MRDSVNLNVSLFEQRKKTLRVILSLLLLSMNIKTFRQGFFLILNCIFFFLSLCVNDVVCKYSKSLFEDVCAILSSPRLSHISSSRTLQTESS